jgi:hypothetical protein
MLIAFLLESILPPHLGGRQSSTGQDRSEAVRSCTGAGVLREHSVDRRFVAGSAVVLASSAGGLREREANRLGRDGSTAYLGAVPVGVVLCMLEAGPQFEYLVGEFPLVDVLGRVGDGVVDRDDVWPAQAPPVDVGSARPAVLLQPYIRQSSLPRPAGCGWRSMF